MNSDFVAELTWRGLVHDVRPGTAEQLNKEITTAYIGFDPTAASLHIGNLASLMLLVHLQRAGYRSIALVGGATGMIGDPSGKSAEREFLSEETLRHNQAGIAAQLRRFLNFEGQNAAEVVNNYDWFREIGFLEFLRTAGKHLTVNYMMSKDSVKNRLEGGTGLSFTEFSYQLLQGYDFYHLYTHQGVKLQMGGSDQWGNITAGTELIRRMAGGEAFALTTPLLTKADGTKFGKSEGGNVWLDANLTSPYQFYQFWVRKTADAELPRLLRTFTLLSREEIEALEKEHYEAPHQRLGQKTLAREVTTLVHGPEAWRKAVEASEILYGKGNLEALQALDEATLLDVFADVPQVELSRDAYAGFGTSLDLLFAATEPLGESNKLFKSKGDARKLLSAGAVSVNRTKLSDPTAAPNFTLLNDRYLLVQKGKEYLLIKVK